MEQGGSRISNTSSQREVELSGIIESIYKLFG